MAGSEWHPPQKARSVGREGRTDLGFTLCSSGVWWQVVQGSPEWWETDFCLAISP